MKDLKETPSINFRIKKELLSDFIYSVLKAPVSHIADQLMPVYGCSRDEYMKASGEWTISEDEIYLYGSSNGSGFDYSQVFYICGLDWDSSVVEEEENES